MAKRTIRIEGTEYASAREAFECCEIEGWEVVILAGGKTIGTTQAQADELARDGVSFAYLGFHNDRMMTVPVN